MIGLRAWHVLLLSIVLLVSHAEAQVDSSQRSFGAILSGDAVSALKDAGAIFTSPLRYSREDWITAGAIVGGTAVLFALDKPARTLAQENQSRFGDGLFSVGRSYGVPYCGAGIAAGLYGVGLVSRDEKWRTTGVLIVEAMAYAGAITTVMKTVVGRSRPFMEEGNLRFRGFQFKDGTTSMPSGHATVAFAVSSVLAERIHNTYASVLLYGLAALTGVSRVYHDEHWVSDSFLGGAIGTTVGISLCRLHEHSEETSSVHLVPIPAGLRMVYTF